MAMRLILGRCCARAVRGQNASPQPVTIMKSRRFIDHTTLALEPAPLSNLGLRNVAENCHFRHIIRVAPNLKISSSLSGLWMKAA